MVDLASILWISAFAFLVSLLLTPAVRDWFALRGLVDQPDGGRKLHTLAVPRAGGIPIAFAYAAAFGVLLAMPDARGSVFERRLPAILGLLPSAGLIFLVGLLDDLRGLRPWQKLAGQSAAASMAVAGGVRITGLSGHQLDPAVGAALTVLWLIACCNAFNLIDGLDGLATGMGLFSTLTIFLAALLHQDHTLALATLPLAGALLGFLRYNFSPASVFLGDSGSLLIGFLLGCYGVIWSQKSATMLGMTAPLMAMAIPLIDVFLSIIRRWLRGKPIFSGDRSHIHHKLLERGLTHRRVVAVLYGVCGIYAVLSLLQSLSERRLGGLVLVLFCAVTWIGIRHLNYFEFGMAGRTFFGGGLRRLVNNQIALHALDGALEAAPDETGCWDALHLTLAEAGFAGMHARLNGREFRHAFSGNSPHWQLRIPLPGGDYVNLERSFDAPVPTVLIGPLVELLHRRLSSRLALFSAQTEPTALSLARLAERVDSFELGSPALHPSLPAERQIHPVS
jgi:UDP-GlcNAc:undecaprenyl-phosphate/decaprenyl-phosphate GlcNAc-1-phosphate transferase